MAFLVLLKLLLIASAASAAVGGSEPRNCTDTTRLCASFLAYRTIPSTTLPQIQSMFDAAAADVTADEAGSPGYVFVRKNCSCSAGSRKYLANTTFTVPWNGRTGGGSVAEAVEGAYGGLAVLPDAARRARRGGAVVALHLLCGCSNGVWNYLMSYVMADGDSVESLSSRFGVSMDNIEIVNGLDGPGEVVVGNVYYIPLDSVPGRPYSAVENIFPAPSPAPVSYKFSENLVHQSARFPYGWVIGSIGVALVLVGVTLFSCITLKSDKCLSKILWNQRKDHDRPILHKFHILKSTRFCYNSGSFLCHKSGNARSPQGNGCSQLHSVSHGMVDYSFDVEKPVVFPYEEILSSTNAFSDSNLLGHGTYGSVFYGILQDQEVAIKRMTATNTKEFMVEMKVLCKVHHANLVELIGYATSNDELFLIYEYAQKGSLQNHLHNLQSKGHSSLSWISRVQISLDAARGLEYIHEHAKNHYLHRDIKTSNILLDSSFRAKVSDFGLAKLIVKTNDEEASATRVVGTFGYLSPEYMRDGIATTKSDVFAFGVVLFELISGREAMTRADKYSEKRSLASIMLGALKNSPNSMSMGSLRECIDPNLMDLYPHDCVYKMATLAKQCVDEDPMLRPDMKQVVITLSNILLSSVEWEAALAGNSQIFSGLVQGR